MPVIRPNHECDGTVGKGLQGLTEGMLRGLHLLTGRIIGIHRVHYGLQGRTHGDLELEGRTED